MPLSRIWKRTSKPLIVGFAISVSIIVCFASLHATDGAAAPIFSEILASFPALVIFGTTLSVALFNYIDNISKDVSALDSDSDKIGIALTSLGALKKEVVINAGLIIVLLVLELAAKGLEQSIPPKNIPFESFGWVVLSGRFSIFILAILAASEQIRGLLVAIEYRAVIHAGKSSNK